jgi:hypothetical protein
VPCLKARERAIPQCKIGLAGTSLELLTAFGLTSSSFCTFQVDGKPTKLPLFEGQNVTEQVLRFGDATGIKPDGLAKVFAEVNRGLRSQGLAPLAEFQIQYNGMSLPIQFHQGENLLSVVRTSIRASCVSLSCAHYSPLWSCIHHDECRTLTLALTLTRCARSPASTAWTRTCSRVCCSS